MNGVWKVDETVETNGKEERTFAYIFESAERQNEQKIQNKK
jgi:hypothetical protein